MDGDWGILFWIIQVCGAAALVIQNGAVFLPCGKKIMKMQVVSCLLWAAHYGLRGFENIMVMCLAGAWLNTISSMLNKPNLIKYNIFHNGLLILFLISTMTVGSDVWPILAIMFGFLRMISRDDLVRFHTCGMICGMIWTGYHFYCESWFGVFNDSIVTITCTLALLKILSSRKAVTQAVPA